MKKFKKLNKYLVLFIFLGAFLFMLPISFVTAEADFELYDTGLEPPGYNPTFKIPYEWQTVEHLSGNTYRFKIKFTYSSFWSQANLVIDGAEYQVSKYSTYGDYFFDYSCYCYRRREYYQYSYVDVILDDFGSYEYYYNSWVWPECTTEDLWAIYFSHFTIDTGLTPPGYNPTFKIPYEWQTVEHLSGNTYRFKIKFTYSSFWSQANLVIDGAEYQVSKYSTYGDYFFDYSCYCYRRREYYQYSYVDVVLDEIRYYEYYYNSWVWPECTTEDLWAIYLGPSTLDGSIDKYFLDLVRNPSKLGFQIETLYDFGIPTPFITYQIINGLGLWDDVVIKLYIDDQLIDSRFTYLPQIGDSIEVVVETELLRQVGTHRIDIQIDNIYHYNDNFKLGYLKVGNIGFSQNEDELGWGLDLINAEIVWGGFDGATDVTTNIYGQGIKVLVIDTGLDYTHFDLDDNHNNIDSYDYYHGDSDPFQVNDDHGTATSGIIAMEDNGAGYIGVAPGVRISMAKTFSDNGAQPSYQSFVNFLCDAVIDAIGNYIDVISISMGLPKNYWTQDQRDQMATAFEQAYNAGITIVVSAGNDDTDEISWPAALDSVIAVGAINQDFERISIEGWWGSNYGDGLDIMAPGIDISTTDVNNQYMEDFGGTSGACPFVAGTCALILCTNPFLSPLEVRECLYNSANTDSIPDYNFYEYGYGVVDAEAAVNYALTHFP